MKRVKNHSLYIALLVAFATALLFQNCGKGFQSSVGIGLASSAQCLNKLRQDVGQMNLDRSKLNCDAADSYVCERRIFRPGVGNESFVTQECPNDKSLCVDVEVRNFDTEVARNGGENPALFNEGGSYNREEIKCNYRYLYNGISPFEGEGASLEESLERTIASCHRAKDGI